MVRTGERRRLAFGLIGALLVNAALLALMAPKGRDVAWPAPADTGIALRLALTRGAPARVETPPMTTPNAPSAPSVQRSPQPSTEPSITASAQARLPAVAIPTPQGSRPVLPSPSSDQAAKTSAVQGSGDADLRAKTALALRKFGACSRVNSGNGDAQDKALCAASFPADEGASLDSIAAEKRAGYDAAHAKAGYLVPADAANPNFVTSQFKRGGTVVSGHAGCALVDGKWSCVGR
jgi:hypothetical protein